MKKLILILLLLISTIGYGQDNSEHTILRLKSDGWFTLSVGTGILGMTYITHSGQELNTKQRVGMYFCVTVGVGLDIYSFTRFYKARRLKKTSPKLP